MAALDTAVDELYQLPLAEFTAARNALAKTLSGNEARRVRRLEKPTLVPWAINQVYWRARPVYDRLLKSGKALRDVQIKALEGKKTDVRAAADAHRKALAEAVDRAQKLAASDGSRPDAEPLSRMFEALSLAAEPPAEPGRFTNVVRPAGFEALTGVTVSTRQRAKMNKIETEPGATRKQLLLAEAERRREEEDAKRRREEDDAKRARENEARKRDEEAEARLQAQIKAAGRELEQARAAETRARRDLERAEQAVRAAEQSLARLTKN